MRIRFLPIFVLPLIFLHCTDIRQTENHRPIHLDSLLACLPEVVADEIGFKRSDAQYGFRWMDADMLVPIANDFYDGYLSEYDHINLWEGYQDLSAGIISLGKGKKSLLLLQEVRNGDIFNIFLLPIQADGLADTLFRAATMEKSPDDLLLEKSHLDTVNNQVRKIRLFSFLEDNGVVRDSLTYLYEIDNSGFTLVQKDSIRIME